MNEQFLRRLVCALVAILALIAFSAVGVLEYTAVLASNDSPLTVAPDAPRKK